MNVNTNTSITGAMMGAAVGGLAVYLGELFGHVDIPSAVEGMLLVICTGLVSLVWPANPPA
jgi:hypothetical protein